MNRSTAVQPDKGSNDMSTVGQYPDRPGVILVTNDGILGSLVGHSGIIYNSNTTIESFPLLRAPKNNSNKKVDGITTYRNNWNTRYKKVYAVTPSETLIDQDRSAAKYAYN